MSPGNNTLHLQVTELIEFSGRTGDLVHFSEGPTGIEGIRGHQKIQSQRNGHWQKELVVKQCIRVNTIEVNLQGRLDLVSEDMINPIVEEIKTTLHDPINLPNSKISLHWAQAKVYAYLYCLQNAIDTSVDVRVTWLNLKEQKITTRNIIFSHEQLKDFTYELLEHYLQWHSAYTSTIDAFTLSAKALTFPFEQYRARQHDFARRVYQQIKVKQSLLIEAPTGIGKTISVLFPAIKSMGEGMVDQIVYITFRNVIALSIQKTLALLAQKGLRIFYVSLQAKEKSCPCLTEETRECSRNEAGICTRTIGFYDRLPAARNESLQRSALGIAEMRKIADKHHICPFEFSLELARWAQLVICDANYLFDPLVKLHCFDEREAKRVCLIDEVHHLPERARQMYSVTLSTTAIDAGVRGVTKRSGGITTIAKRLCDNLNQLDQTSMTSQPPESLVSNVEALHKELTVQLQQEGPIPAEHNPMTKALLRDLRRFQRINENLDLSYRCVVEKSAKATSLQVLCCDASHFLAQHQLNLRSTIGFSATLNPIDQHKRLSGMPEGARTDVISSIFPIENQLTLSCSFVDTRWKHRIHSLAGLAEIISRTYTAKPGKYLVYFPSYAYMDLVFRHVRSQFPDITLTMQTKNCSIDDQKAFIDLFLVEHEAIIGFAILGGVFAEGIDLPGDKLTGAIIVSAGMPQPDPQQLAIEHFYREQQMNSFALVYQIPGMTRVAQAAGRVIRSESDRGVVILVDPRFNRRDYRQLMPKHWQISSCSTPHALQDQLTRFWQLNTRSN